MDFAFLPPEVNSGRMYSGPGSGSLMAAAGSWDALSAELDLTAATCASALSTLATLHWHGPAAQTMTATTTPYLDWLHSTAEQTRQTALQARAAAAAYELAFAMTVPPAAVTANRTQLAALIATNFFGQNTAAIAATEAQYAEYWAQDATAMYGYAANTAAATTTLPRFGSPPSAAGAVSRAVSAATTALTATTSAAPSILPANAPLLPDGLTVFTAIRAVDVTINSTAKVGLIETGIIGAEDRLGILPDLGAAAKAAEAAPALSASSLGGGPGLGGITATLARAGTIGSMSVPASWTTPVGGTVTALPGTDVSAAATGGPARPASGLPGLPGVPGGTGSRATLVVPRYGARLTVMSRPPAAG